MTIRRTRDTNCLRCLHEHPLGACDVDLGPYAIRGLDVGGDFPSATRRGGRNPCGCRVQIDTALEFCPVCESPPLAANETPRYTRCEQHAGWAMCEECGGWRPSVRTVESACGEYTREICGDCFPALRDEIIATLRRKIAELEGDAT